MKKCAFLFSDVCLAPDRQIGIHSQSCWELSYIICGAGTRSIGEITESFAQGEIVLIPPHIPHGWHFDPEVTDADGNIGNISVFFDPSILSDMRGLFPEMTSALRRIESLDHVVTYRGVQYQNILRLLTLMRGKTPESRFPLMMELLLAISDVAVGVATGGKSPKSRTARRLEQVRIYCDCNYGRTITIDEISKYAGMNKSAFCSFMRHNTGITFSAYLNNIRLERAREKLIHSDLGVAEISLACGFQNVTYFNRLFRRRYGCTPKAVRMV